MGMLKDFVSRSGNKVEENANAANDPFPARRHPLPTSSVLLVGTATETKVSTSG